MNACVIYDSNTGAVALSPTEAVTNVVRQGRNEAAVALRKEAERFGDEIEYVVYMGNSAYKELEKRNVTSLWKEFLKNPLPCIAGTWGLFAAVSMISILWLSAIIGHPTKGTLSPWIAAATTGFFFGLARFLWKELKNDLSSVSHIKKFGFTKDFLPTARRYSQNMIGVGRDSLYVFAAPMSGDMTVNKIGYDQIQHVRNQSGILNVVSRGGQVIETVYSYESEYKGDVPSDIMNRHLEVTK